MAIFIQIYIQILLFWVPGCVAGLPGHLGWRHSRAVCLFMGFLYAIGCALGQQTALVSGRQERSLW